MKQSCSEYNHIASTQIALYFARNRSLYNAKSVPDKKKLPKRFGKDLFNKFFLQEIFSYTCHSNSPYGVYFLPSS